MRNKSVILIVLVMLFAPHAYANHADTVLYTLAKQQGFFFFYSSSCPHCQRFAPTLKRVSQQYGFSVVAISMDGGFLSSFPDAVMDEGQARVFQINVFPSLFLINPNGQVARLVTEGNIDESELINRLLKISQSHNEEVAL
ncbi:TPA: type-F conjugative transfer system pilin assembly thiol-disulfide isomerase TrbB [Legionella pneumophila]|nr:type-F conjugative transfer system pilin assembly thiol-disulfide isomerase TrbB [Legionella pneumophila]HAU0297561.1 type-F conjugative transfer system pilin assembly thiol-disulfide isomerase TrbB [Legionella pneumophila]